MPSEKPDDYRIIFARELPISGEPGTIAVVPSTNSWNDFGLRIRVDITIYPRRQTSSQGEVTTVGFFGFADPSLRYGDTRDLRQVLDEASTEGITPDKVAPFFTMLPDMESYRLLVAQLGSDETRFALRALCDMVAAEDGPITSRWLRAAQESPVFLRGFLRTSESYFAWKNAGPILQGEEFEEIGRISETLRIQFQLEGRPNAHDLEFRFALQDMVLPKRFAIVIGKNGVGKSQTLGRIASAALKGTGDLTDGDGQRPLFNRVLAFYPTATSSSVFPRERRRGARVRYRRFSLGHAGVGRGRQSTADLIMQLARSTERIRANSRLEIFLDAIRAVEGHEELALLQRRDLPGFVYFLDLLNGPEGEMLDRYASIDPREEPVRVNNNSGYELSSGELAFVRFAALASLHIENGTLLLFDEPETHLHPNFIGQFVVLLDNLLEQTGSVAILSTHSSYFVREAFEDQVRILRSGPDREITVEVPRLKTFGADVGTISYFVFGEDEPSRLAKEVKNRIARITGTWDEVFETYKDDLSLELLSEIRAKMEGLDTGSSGA